MLRSIRITVKRLKRFVFSMLLVLTFLITVNSSTQVTSQTEPTIPSPEEAAQLSAQLSAEELAQINIDVAIRDQLRFDPRWQPIMRSVRQDLIEFRWNDGKLEHPIWEQYGHKIYPLLNYYTRSSDDVRQKYGITGIRALGKPYTTLWLAEQLERGGEDLEELSFSVDILPIIQDEFGITEGWELRGANTETLELLMNAVQGDDPSQKLSDFNTYFLEVLARYNLTEYPSEYRNYPSYEEVSLPGWEEFEPIDLLSRERIQALIIYFDALPIHQQSYVLAYKLGPAKAGEISLAGKALLKHIAANATSPYQAWSIAELDRHGDSEGTQLLKVMVDSDFSKLAEMTRFTDWESGYLRAHTYLLLVSIFEKYPDSTFTQACREFGDLRGMSYVGRQPRSEAIQARVASRSPAETAHEWQQWLQSYPHHPGEDDAMHFLARSLQAQGKTIEAMRLWLDVIVKRPGDQDALEVAWLNVRPRLDVGLTLEQIQQLIENYQSTPIVPLLQYALAVHHARLHQYAEALTVTEGIDLNAISPDVLGSYYDQEKLNIIQAEMQAFLVEQRQRWQKLEELVAEKTPESQYAIATNWIDPDGWKNGYLPFWSSASINREVYTRRIALLPFHNPMVCELYWVCDAERRPESEIVNAYQEASPNNTALKIYQTIINSLDASLTLKEKSLYMMAQTLLTQWELFLVQETIAIHPPAGVAGSFQIARFQQSPSVQEIVRQIRDDDESKYRHGELSHYQRADYRLIGEIIDFERGNESNPFYSAVMNQIKVDYQQTINKIVSSLKQDFPNSNYIDDLLFSSYFFSKSKSYLTDIVNNYPNGDRFSEAQFLLNRSN